jgi:phosphoesterase RecJ-like protein
VSLWPDEGPSINIDHHETNTFFGRHNLVDADSSSTGELVYRLIECGEFPLDHEVAENLFAAIQSDTGSFRFTNTTSNAMRISADLMDHGIIPWQIYQKITERIRPERLKLLAGALAQVEFHGEGKIGMMVLKKECLRQSGAQGPTLKGLWSIPGISKGLSWR